MASSFPIAGASTSALLMRYLHLPDDDRPRLAALVADRVVDLADAVDGIRSLDDLVRAGPDIWERLQATAAARFDESFGSLPAGPLPAPLASPSKIVAVGSGHASPRGDAPDEPTVFAKFPSALTGPGMPISWPTDVTQQVDGRAELGVVVGRRLRRATPEECLAGIFGYTVVNDLTARDLQHSDGQWTRSKNLDGFCPIGPLVVTAEECQDPQSLRISTYVNDVLQQESNTEDMSLCVAELLSYASRSFTLHPGDLLLAVTPEGAGASHARPAFLSPGDEVTVSIEGIGDLTNPILPYL